MKPTITPPPTKVKRNNLHPAAIPMIHHMMMVVMMMMMMMMMMMIVVMVMMLAIAIVVNYMKIQTGAKRTIKLIAHGNNNGCKNDKTSNNGDINSNA